MTQTETDLNFYYARLGWAFEQLSQALCRYPNVTLTIRDGVIMVGSHWAAGGSNLILAPDDLIQASQRLAAEASHE